MSLLFYFIFLSLLYLKDVVDVFSEFACWEMEDHTDIHSTGTRQFNCPPFQIDVTEPDKFQGFFIVDY